MTMDAQSTTSPIAERRRTATDLGTDKLEFFTLKKGLTITEK